MTASTLALFGGPPAVTSEWRQDWPVIGDGEINAVIDLLRHGVLSIYDRSGIIAAFEDAFAEYHSADDGPPFALSHNAGTSALHGAYFGLGLGVGDEVIVPTYTFLATVTPLLQCGATPVFADADPESLTISPDSVAERITARTRAIVATHMWGHPADMTALGRLAESMDLQLVEDCSHAHGATIDGRKVGTFGTAACFSLEGHKAMVAGEGGVMLTRSRQVYERALLLGHFGRRAKDEVQRPELASFAETGFGQKYRMHPLAAAIALEQLRKLDTHNARRGANLNLLTRLLTGIPGIRPPTTAPGMTRGGWYGYKPRYVADELGGLGLARYITALRAEGVRVKLPGSPPLHRLPVFQLTDAEAAVLKLPAAARDARRRGLAYPCPQADAVYPTLLSLPTFTGDCDEVIHQYARAFTKVSSSWKELLE
jgi:perosamine synthetase